MVILRPDFVKCPMIRARSDAPSLIAPPSQMTRSMGFNAPSGRCAALEAISQLMYFFICTLQVVTLGITFCIGGPVICQVGWRFDNGLTTSTPYVSAIPERGERRRASDMLPNESLERGRDG